MKFSTLALSFAMLTGGSLAHAADEAPAVEEAAAPVEVTKSYSIDKGKTFIYAKTLKGGVLEGLAHDHAIQAKEIKGSISFSNTDASKNTISITIDVASMDVDGAKLRQKAGLDEGPNEEGAQTIKENMLADDQLMVSKHKTMAFKSSSISPKGGVKYIVEGNLTIRGVTKKVSFPVTISAEVDAFHGKGSLKFNHSDFGFEPYSAAFGAITNQEEITLFIDLYGKAK